MIPITFSNFPLLPSIVAMLSLLLVLISVSHSSSSSFVLASNIDKFIPQHISNKLSSLTEVIDFDSIDPSQIPASVPSDSIIRDRAQKYLFVLATVYTEPTVVAFTKIYAFDTETNEYSTTLQSEEFGKATQNSTTSFHTITVAVVKGTFVVRVFGDPLFYQKQQFGRVTIAFDADLKQIGKPDSTGASQNQYSDFSSTFSNKVQFPSSSSSSSVLNDKQFFFTTSSTIVSSPIEPAPSPIEYTSLIIYELPWKGWTSGEPVFFPPIGEYSSYPMGSRRAGLIFDNERSVINTDYSNQFFVFYVPMMDAACGVSVARINVTRRSGGVPDARIQNVQLTKYLDDNTSSCSGNFPKMKMITASIVIDSVNSVLLASFGNQNLFKLTLRDDGIVAPTQLFLQGSVGAGIFSPKSLLALSAMILLPESQTILVMVQYATPVRLFQLDYSGQDTGTIKQVNVTVVHSPSIPDSRGVSVGMLHHSGGESQQVPLIFGVCWLGEIIEFSQNIPTTITTTTTTLPMPSSSTSTLTMVPSTTITNTTTSTTSTIPTSSTSTPSTTETSTTPTTTTTPTPAPTTNTSTSTSTTTTSTTISTTSPPTTSTEIMSTTTTTLRPSTSQITETDLPHHHSSTTTESTLSSTSSSSSTLSALVPSTTTSSTPTETTSPSHHHNNNHNSSKNDNYDKGSKSKTTEIAGGVAAAVVVLLLGGFFLYRMNRNKQRSPMVFDDSQLGDNLIQDNDAYHNQNYGTV